MAEGMNHFAEIADLFPRVAGRIVRKTAFDMQVAIQARMRTNGQIDTGFLVNSVYVETSEESTYQGGDARALPEIAGPETPLSASVGIAASYAVYQNYGTRYQPARPFLEPAVEDVRPGFETACAALEQALREAGAS